MSNQSGEEDKDLVDRCLKGEALSQKKLFEKFYAKMLTISLRYTNQNLDEAKDIAQDGFVKVFQNLNKFNATSSLEYWIKRIVINTAIDSYRKKAVLPKFIDVDDAHQVSTNETISAQLSAEELLALVQKLPTGYRMIFNLYAIDGLSHKEIANSLGITEGTSKSQLSKARLTLQKMLLTLNHQNPQNSTL